MTFKEKICTGSSKTFLRYPWNPPQITRSCNSYFFQFSSWLTAKLISVFFWPKSDLRPVLGSHKSPLGPQKSQIELTIASFLSPNWMEHTVYYSNILLWPFSFNSINLKSCHKYCILTTLLSQGQSDRDGPFFIRVNPRFVEIWAQSVNSSFLLRSLQTTRRESGRCYDSLSDIFEERDSLSYLIYSIN